MPFRLKVVPIVALTAITAVWNAGIANAAVKPAPNAKASKTLDELKAPLQFGHDPSLPLPKSLLFSLSPDKILADAPAWKAMGVDGFFMDSVASDWSSDIWATDGKPYTIGASDATFQKVRKANALCRRLGMQTFLKVAFGHPFEWYNDTAWQQINHHFREFAIFARETGCTGVALDIEYIGDQYSFAWSGYDYHGYTRKDLIRTVRKRATGMLRAMYDEFPDMVFLVLPEEGLSLGAQIQTAWIEEAARRDAPGGVQLFTESTYTSTNLRRIFAHIATSNALLHRLLSPRARAYWKKRCSLAAGAWPTGYDVDLHHNPKNTPDDIRRCWAGTLMVSPRYNWIYADRYADQLLGRHLDAYPGKMDFAVCADILRKKEVVTNPAYVRLAEKIRRFSDDNFASELGVVAVPRFLFPHVVPSVELTALNHISPEESRRQWRIAMDYYHGVKLDLQATFGPVRDWQIIGPFPNKTILSGHNTVFPPERGIDLTAEYAGAKGNVKWRPYHVPDGVLGINFRKLYDPNQLVTAYALCYVTSPTKRRVEARFATNDCGKLWIGGKLVDDYPDESWSVLDRDIIPVTLPKGRTPILAKVTNGKGEWAMALRFTDSAGNVATGLTYSATP